MPTEIRRPLLSALSAFVLLTFTTFSVDAHQVDPASVSSPASVATEVTASGIVSELIVDNQVTNVAQRYLSLRLDEGKTVALTGAGLDSLSDGARITATGSLAGSLLVVTNVTVIPPSGNASNAKILAAPKKNQVQGMLVIYHKDYFTQGRGEYGLGVHDRATKMTRLNLGVIPDAVRAGMTVNVSGTVAADGASMDPTQITILGLAPAEAPNLTAAPVTNNVLVMPIKFTNSPASDPFTPAQVDQVMRTNPDGVAAYYNEVSYGQQQLNITVACATAPVPAGCASRTAPGGWLQSTSAAPASCDFTTIGNLADQTATAAGYNLANYKNRFYVIPNLPCGWAGLAYVGYPYQAWSNAVNALWVYGHELGHNFNLWHAGSVNCGSQVLGGSCSVAEYGDRFDIMGNNSGQNQQMHFNAAQKATLNWIPASSVRAHTSGTATYTLSPLELAGQATYAVKIPVAADGNRTYWIEYRQPIGFDSGMAGYPNNGAQIRVANPFDYPCTNCGGDDTELLDMTPATSGNFADAALLAGQTYTDSTNGISVTVNSATASALSVTVSMGGGKTSTTTALATSGSPSQTGALITFTATVTGNSPTGTVSFTSDGIAVCSGVALASGRATCGTTTLATGTHTIAATYTGDANNNGSSGSLSQTVNSVAPPPPGGSLVNPGFETPALGSSYQYAPTASGVGWTFANGSGIQGNGSAWAAAAAPDGTQTAFIQGTGTISQTVSLTAGSYVLSFKAAQRACCTTPYALPIQVSVDGVPVGSPASPTSTGFADFSVAFSVATTGAHTITFSGSSTSDKSTFIDSVALTMTSPPSSLVNPGFEAPALGANYQYAPTAAGVGWSFANGSGIQGNGSAWGAASAPEGSQTAFIQGTGTISQTLSLTASSYTLSFKAAQRSCCASPYVQPIQVSVDGVPVGSPASPTSTGFASFSIMFSVATTGAHAITLTGTIAGDKSTFIDSVALTIGSPPAALVNPGFETPVLGASYQYAPTAAGVGWTFANGSGIQGNGSAWGAATAPDGSQSAFIQSTGSISQTLNLNAGSYTLSFKAARRAYSSVSSNLNPIIASIDGAQIGSTVSPASTGFGIFNIPFSVSSSGAHTITFSGTATSDTTTFIDGITLQ